MPETGQPGGASLRGRASGSQGGQMALGMKGPFLKVLYLPYTAGNVTRTIKCPIGIRWNVINVAVDYDNDSTVADRIMSVTKRDADGLNLCIVLYSGTHAADAVGTDFAGASESNEVTLYFAEPLVDQMQLHFSYGAGVAGDIWRARVTVMEWKI